MILARVLNGKCYFTMIFIRFTWKIRLPMTSYDFLRLRCAESPYVKLTKKEQTLILANVLNGKYDFTMIFLRFTVKIRLPKTS